MSGALHPHPQDVTDPTFQGSVFFDPNDLVQVKYEMLRQVRVDSTPVSSAAAAFGLSRPAFYQARDAFANGGVPGLLPRKRGPRGAHKLTDEILSQLVQAREENPALRLADLVVFVRERFGVHVHPRSIERRLARFLESPEKKPHR
jgi:transposase